MGKYNTDCKRQDITRRRTRASAADVNSIGKRGDGAWIDEAGRDASSSIRMPEYDGERVGQVINRCPFCLCGMRAASVEHVEHRGKRDLVTYNMRCDGCGSEHTSRSWQAAGKSDPARPVVAPMPKKPAWPPSNTSARYGSPQSSVGAAPASAPSR